MWFKDVNMKWIRYDIKTKTDASDIITAELYDLGITSVEVTDNILPERIHLQQIAPHLQLKFQDQY